MSCTKQKSNITVGLNGFRHGESAEGKECYKIDTEKCKFQVKFRTRSPPQADLYQNIAKKQWLVHHFWVDLDKFEPLKFIG
jgi:hypothetical protein